MMIHSPALPILFFLTAMLYSSVGHGGASGYLAAMALYGLDPKAMKPAALVLNIIVSSIATVRFYRAGHFSWKIFWPFAISSIPFAFIGGAWAIPNPIYKKLLGAILWFAAFRFFLPSEKLINTKPVALPLAIPIGAAIGLLSGLTGVGGGIFLSPLLILAGWAETHQTAAISALFIAVNSVAGLSGHLASLQSVPTGIGLWGCSVLLGGWIGSYYGSRRFTGLALRRLLAIVLAIAGLKLIFA